MRTLVDIPDPDLEQIAEIGRRRGVSRARVIREAIGEYLSRHTGEGREAAFGLWGRRAMDGLAYQRKIRAEW